MNACSYMYVTLTPPPQGSHCFVQGEEDWTASRPYRSHSQIVDSLSFQKTSRTGLGIRSIFRTHQIREFFASVTSQGLLLCCDGIWSLPQPIKGKQPC